MAIGLTFGRSLDPRAGRAFGIKVECRVIGLIALGLALNYLAVIGGHLGAAPVGPEDIPSLRIPGVLQRIALCYFLAVMIVSATAGRAGGGPLRPNVAAIGAAIAAILILYWALLTFVPVPGFGAGALDPAGNLPAYIDRAIFTPRHMWPLGSTSWRGPVVYDPEGLLSSLPATANVLFGVVAVAAWRRLTGRRVVVLMAAGICLIASGLLLGPLFPLNKKIWTSSFVLLTSGFSCLALVCAAAIVGTETGRRLVAPLNILGGNAILAYAISIFLSALGSIPLTGGKTPENLQTLGYDAATTFVADPYLASFACALGVLAFVVLVIWPLHRRAIHLRL